MRESLPEKVLMISPDSIAASVMSLPAVQMFHQKNPNIEITVLASREIAPLWGISPAVHRVQCMKALLPTVKKLKRESYGRVYIFPDTFRSALLAHMAGIPRRIGVRGHWRRLLLAEIVHRPEDNRQFEYMNILGVQGNLPVPELVALPEHFQTLERKLYHLSAVLKVPADKSTDWKMMPILLQCLEKEYPLGARPIIVLLPSADAAWPAEHFILLAKNLYSSLGSPILLAGDEKSSAICRKIAALVGPAVINLAGLLTFSERTALLTISRCTVSDDADAICVAGATGTSTVVVGGLAGSDRSELPAGHVILQKKDGCGMCGVDEVFSAVRNLLGL